MARPKVIDDNKLIELFRQGKSLKQMGDALGVSHVAVHKRIKRLGLLQLPESFGNLTDKEKQFCLSVARGQSRINAVMQTYDVTSRESAKALQRTLMKNPEIRVAIDDLMEQKGIGREFRIEKLGEHMKSIDPVVSLKALDMGFKLSGDEQEAKRHNPDTPSFIDIKIDLLPELYPETCKKIEGKCISCNTEIATGEFCTSCIENHPARIDKIERFLNGDKCAICRDDRRSYEYCKACKEAKASINHDGTYAHPERDYIKFQGQDSMSHPPSPYGDND